MGLSPRVRGNRLLDRRSEIGMGSIPASAGEPLVYTLFNGQGRVYPRECGGTANAVQTLEDNGGLSPRVRGNPLAGYIGYCFLR